MNYTTEFCQTMYNHFSELYRERFMPKPAGVPAVTWRHISYWRKWRRFYGLILIDRGLLSKKEFDEAKAPVVPINTNLQSLKKTIL